MNSCVVNVVTSRPLPLVRYSQPSGRISRYSLAQARLKASLGAQRAMMWTGQLPVGCPSHQEVPYAFKAYAMMEAAKECDLLLWADACIIVKRDLTPLWERIEREGYWISGNWWNNYHWTADSAYPDLFPEYFHSKSVGIDFVDLARAQNKKIMHILATTFGINTKSAIGKAFLDEYFRLASQTKAFCGPWLNSNCPENTKGLGGAVGPCGPEDVRGHRHDQTAASVIAWRLGMKWTQGPEIFSYAGSETNDTILVADGSY